VLKPNSASDWSDRHSSRASPSSERDAEAKRIGRRLREERVEPRTQVRGFTVERGRPAFALGEGQRRARLPLTEGARLARLGEPLVRVARTVSSSR
jgi:hypothetical protein